MAQAQAKTTIKKHASRSVAKGKTALKRAVTPSPEPHQVRLPGEPRKLRAPKYKSLRLSKRIKHPVKIPGAFRLIRTALRLLGRNRRLFIGITIIYGLLNIILVTGLANKLDLTSLKSTLQTAFGSGGAVTSTLTVFAVLVSSVGGSVSGAASAYQLILTLIASLAIIWALREVSAGTRVRVRDAYYRGMTPLVPFALVLVVIGLQLVPLIVGGTVFNIVINNGIAVYAAEKFLWGALFALLGLLSIYMISSSIFALYIVTLPDMTPLKALRSARALVRFRRWTVLRKVLVLPVMLLVLLALIMLPVIYFATAAAQWVFFALTMFGTAVVHSYLYTLYRELIRE